MSNDRLTSDLSNLDNLDGTGLVTTWQRHLGGQAPAHLPRSLLVRLLAYKLQSEKHGSLPKSGKLYLKSIEADLKAGRVPETPYLNEKQLSIGTQLTREHNGILHRVMVVKDSFAWNGKTYASLSAVAKAITGTNWNGNRFFSLKNSVRPDLEKST
jgi:hypothetical protein